MEHQPPKRIATYSRVSTSHKDQKPEVQVEELRRYCAARGWVITHEIVDHGYSGGTDSRSGLKQLMELVRSREVDCVVVVKLDRLFRSLKHLVTTLEEMQALKVLFVAMKDNVDYSTPAGRLFVQVLGLLSEFERALIRERTLMGLAHARAKGKRLGRPPKALEGDIRRLRAQGASYRAIRKALGCGMGGSSNTPAPKLATGERYRSVMNWKDCLGIYKQESVTANGYIHESSLGNVERRREC